MGGSASNTVAFTIRGPVTRAELPGLCDRVCALLTDSSADVVLCDVDCVEPDAVTVDVLARLQLAARRNGCRIRVRGASPDLCELIDFMGLADVVCTGPAMTDRRVVRANGVDLCVETFGDPASPALLLIAGAESSMDWWDDEFCERLAAGPRYVIRYDLRDTGQSVTYDPGAPGYMSSDLVADAVGLLDVLGVERAHVVGISMGGGVAQHLALLQPARVASLTLMSTSPAVGRAERDLPPASDELKALFADPPRPPDWSDRTSVVDHIIAGQRPYAGSITVDEQALRAVVERIVDRTLNIESSLTNHSLLEEGEPASGDLRDIEAPTLVLHGTEDPLFPFAHGEALAAEIPNSRLIPLEGMGHEMPPRPLWDRVVRAILEHTAPAR
jgi:pimeloyl-ACP methyl ester carboxylesterase/ABC-type transporter Mla MlaB component